jgi:hypothetical protein
LYAGWDLEELSRDETSIIQELAQELQYTQARVKDLEAALGSKPLEEKGPSGDLEGLIAGTVTKIDQKRGLVSIKLTETREEVSVSLAAVSLGAEAGPPGIGDYIDVYFRGGRVAAAKIRSPDDMTSFVEKIEYFAKLSLQSPGLEGAVSSRLAQLDKVP